MDSPSPAGKPRRSTVRGSERQTQFDQALTVPCPECPALIGTPCASGGQHGPLVHDARWKAGKLAAVQSLDNLQSSTAGAQGVQEDAAL